MKNHLLKAFAVACAMLVSVAAFAQQKISGTIVDEMGPVIGATVSIEGTQIGAVTDLDGKYELNVPANSTVLVSCVGYKDIKFSPKAGQEVYNFTLEEDTLFLDDVVVIGYQTVKRRDLTGSVASITGKEIAEMPVSNAAQALQGKLPGVRVTSGSGAAGSGATIRVRGGNSITQSNDPLVLIDGVSGSLGNIPADEIESIDVLKDASSTAIYGARGANGVILVTTKGAKSGRVSVRYNMYYQYRQTPRWYDVLDTQEFILWQWSYASFYGPAYGDNVAKYYGLGSKYGNHYADYANIPVHNPMNDVLKSSGTWNHDITLSGGTESTNYSLGFNYLSDNGTHIRNQRQRYNVSLKLNQRITNTLSANFDIRYNENVSWGNSDGSQNYYYRPVMEPLGTDDPALLGQGDGNVDPLYDPLLTTWNKENYSYNYNLRATSGLTWNAFKGMTARTELTLTRSWSHSDGWNGGNSIGGSTYKSASINHNHGTNTRWTNTLNYQVPGLGNNHSLNFLLGHEMMTNSSTGSSLNAYGYPADFSFEQTMAMFGLYDKDLVNQNSFSNSVGRPSNTLSFFGRMNYGLLGKYLFTLTFRADGSSKFAPNNRWGYFPAGAFAWRISDEPWMQGTKSWLDELKYRLSYGTSGSDGISANLWRETWSSGSVMMDGKSYQIYRPGGQLPNPDLKWETTISRNTGFDFSFMKGRLRGNVDAYWNTTKDLLMSMPIDGTTGYSSQYQNVGQTSNKGIEFSINYGIVRNRNFQLSVNWNHSYNLNNLDWIDPSANANRRMSSSWGNSDALPTVDYLIQVGRPIGISQGYRIEGVGYYTVDDFDYAGGVYTLKPGIHDTNVAKYVSPDLNAIRPNGQMAFPGAVRLKDLNGDEIANQQDYEPIAEMQPHHTGGFGLQANWKGFDLNAHFSYQIGGFIYNALGMQAVNAMNKDTWFGRNRLAYTADCYKLYNVDASGNLYMVTDPTELNNLNKNAKYPVALSESGYVVDQFIEPGGFLRCNNVTLGYTIPQNVLDKIKVKNLRVYLTGTNLFVLTKYSGLDPEVGNSTLTPGYDAGNYPRPITVTAGLSVTF